MTEGQLQSKIIKVIEKRGGYVVNGIYSKTGIPDLIGCFKGTFFAMEIKLPGLKATKIQQYNLDKINKIGGIAEVITSTEEANDLLDEISVLSGGKYDD